jgi:hypothetical protein
LACAGAKRVIELPVEALDEELSSWSTHLQRFPEGSNRCWRKDDAATAEYRAWIKRFYPEGDADDLFSVYGYTLV